MTDSFSRLSLVWWWAAEHYESDTGNLAGIFLHNSVIQNCLGRFFLRMFIFSSAQLPDKDAVTLVASAEHNKSCLAAA